MSMDEAFLELETGVKIKVYAGHSLREGLDLALKHRLFVAGWALSYELDDARHRPTGKQVALAFKKNVPICVALLAGHSQLMAFCRKQERGNGYASRCVRAIKPTRNSWAGVGLQGTSAFWESLGVNCSIKF